MTQTPVNTTFEEDPPRKPFKDNPYATGDESESDFLLLNIDGYEGPLDLLVDMARKQKIDITQISILQLVRQYLHFIDRARELKLDLAAEYLVMAAWLAYLKSRLLLPHNQDDEEPDGEQMANALAYQLKRLTAMKQAGEKISQSNRLFHERFPRGQADGIKRSIYKSYDCSLFDLLDAYGSIQRRHHTKSYTPVDYKLMSTDEALERLNKLLGCLPRKGKKSVWATFDSFLPDSSEDELYNRSSLAATLLAGLELAKQGCIDIQQDGEFRPIYMRQSDQTFQDDHEQDDLRTA